MRSVRVIAVAGLAALLGACSHVPGGAAPADSRRGPMVIMLTQRDDGGHVRAQVGDTIEIHLPENATTGYRWEPDSLDPHLFELAGATGNYPPGIPGSGGDAQFRIKVLATGGSTLRLKNWRRWEGEGGVIKRFEVKVDAF
jgi:inhibitor of cysteine peptidase